MFDVLLLNRYVAYHFFSRNKYIDIELPSLICTEFPFSLLALHYPPIAPYTHTQTRARTDPLFLFLSLFFFFLNPAISRASCAFFVLLVPHTRACIYSYARLVSHSRNKRSYNNSCPVRPFLFFFFSSPQPPSRETALVPSGRRAAAVRRE